MRRRRQASPVPGLNQPAILAARAAVVAEAVADEEVQVSAQWFRPLLATRPWQRLSPLLRLRRRALRKA
jgi:hypothetical protein